MEKAVIEGVKALLFLELCLATDDLGKGRRAVVREVLLGERERDAGHRTLRVRGGARA